MLKLARIASVTAFVMVAMTAPSFGQANMKERCLAAGKAIKSPYYADTGEAKGVALIAANQKCNGRWKNISLAFRRFNEAVDAGNIDELVLAAEEVRKITQVTSTMYTSCWKTMRAQAASLQGLVDSGVAYIASGACPKPD